MPRVYILTYKRPNRQITWSHLPPKIREDTVLVVDWEERDLYPDYPILVMPEGLSRVSPKRKFILDTTRHDKIIMLDDDIQFYKRKSFDDWHLRPPTPKEMEEMFAEVFDLLSGDYAHVGISSREGNNVETAQYVINTRMMRFLGYHVPTLRAIVKWPLVDVMCDFDITLQLLMHGYPNLVYFKYAQGQTNSNAPGGCSEYRTMEFQEQCAKELTAKYPQFVNLVEKITKQAWGGQKRSDVRIAWKKAFAHGEGKRK